MDQFASHVVRALFLLLCPQLFQSDAPHKSQSFVRSRKSVAWKARQGPLKSIFGDNSDQAQSETSKRAWPPAFHAVAGRYVAMLRTTLDANEVRSLAGNKVACPVLQVRRNLICPALFTEYSIDGTRDRGRSRSLGRTRLPHGPCLGRLDICVSYAIISLRWTGSNPSTQIMIRLPCPKPATTSLHSFETQHPPIFSRPSYRVVRKASSASSGLHTLNAASGSSPCTLSRILWSPRRLIGPMLSSCRFLCMSYGTRSASSAVCLRLTY